MSQSNECSDKLDTTLFFLGNAISLAKSVSIKDTKVVLMATMDAIESELTTIKFMIEDN